MNRDIKRDIELDNIISGLDMDAVNKQLFSTVRHNKLGELKGLFNEHSNDIEIDVLNQHGATLLFLAAQAKNFGVVDFLLEQGADLGKSLAIAKRKGLFGLEGKRVLQNRLDEQPRRDEQLRQAAKAGNLEQVTFWLEHGADPGAKDKNGSAAIHLAVTSFNKEVVSCILDRRPDLINYKGHNNCTPIMSAFFKSDSRTGETFTGFTKEKQLSLVRLLLTYKANLEVGRKLDNGTALHLAVCFTGPTMVALLLEAGANTNAIAQSKETERGPAYCHTPREIAMAISRGTGTSEEKRAEKIEMLGMIDTHLARPAVGTKASKVGSILQQPAVAQRPTAAEASL